MGTNHLSNELEASRKLHPKHIQLLLINEPLLDIQQTWKLKLSTSLLCITYFYWKKIYSAQEEICIMFISQVAQYLIYSDLIMKLPAIIYLFLLALLT